MSCKLPVFSESLAVIRHINGIVFRRIVYHIVYHIEHRVHNLIII